MADHLELQHRDTIAETIERQPFEDGIGEPAIGGRIVMPLFGCNQRIRILPLAAIVDADFQPDLVELLPIRPDAADTGNRPLADPDRENSRNS
jgi:hypothetical protein